MKKPSIVYLILAWLWLAALAPPSLAAMMHQNTSSALAVIYDEGDDPELSGIIKGIEDTSDVMVYRIALNSDRIALAEAVRARAGRPLQLAFNGVGSIAVVYPDIGEPYRSVFTRIIEGIESRTKTRVASFVVGSSQNPQDLAAELRRQNVQVVIALGRNGLKATTGLDRDIGIVVGGVLSVAESDARGMSVHSLAPDPSLLFSQLKALMPNVRRVFVVYDPRQNAWLIRLARDAAKAIGLELVAQEATDLKSAMRFYQETLATADPKKDALWLPQDSVTVDESSVLPLVLQESWNRALTIFSSNMAHVKRGALFSLYPNNLELGHNLAYSALSKMSSGGQSANVITPLKDVLVAVNVRTASHLGLNIGQRQQQAFDMVFPEP
ncbi:MAG: ABC transporter substrate binding protein [Sulfuricellaceae bacterium]